MIDEKILLIITSELTDQASEEDLKQGRFTTFQNSDDLFKHLDSL